MLSTPPPATMMMMMGQVQNYTSRAGAIFLVKIRPTGRRGANWSNNKQPIQSTTTGVRDQLCFRLDPLGYTLAFKWFGYGRVKGSPFGVPRGVVCFMGFGLVAKYLIT